MVATSAIADTPISLVIPYAPGGAADSVAKVAQQTIAKSTNRTVVLEYKPGAGGDIATQYVANAPKDKLVLMLHTINLPINASIKTPSYNISELVPLINFGTMPLILVTGEKSKFTTIKEFKNISSATPINFGSSGIFSVSHLAGEILKQKTNKNLAHVPYQGQSKTIVDIISGNLDMSFLHPDVALPQINANRLIPIAVTTTSRMSTLPNVPTFKESGVGGLELTGYFILISNKTDDPTEYKMIQDSVANALNNPNEIMPYTAVQLEPVKTHVLPESFLITETVKFKELFKKLNLEIK